MRYRIWGAAPAFLALLSLWGCERSTEGLQPAPINTDPVVFLDAFGVGVQFQSFDPAEGAKTDAVSIDRSTGYQSEVSLKVTVPGPGDPTGTFAGGAFVDDFGPRDLTGYDALTFWAKSSKPSTLNTAGLANDNTGTSRYEASWSDIELTTEWTQVIIPIPLSARLGRERGLFYFAEGREGDEGHEIWFDEIQYARTGVITNPQPSITPAIMNTFVGVTLNIQGTQTRFDVGGNPQTIVHLPGYFTYSSSDSSVVDPDDEYVVVVGPGIATVSGSLGSLAVATGSVTVVSTAPPPTAAPDPIHPEENVISMFSDSYPNRFVDTWSATWDRADVTDLQIDGNNLKGYTNVLFAGIEFTSEPVDATEMTHVHLHVFVPSSTAFKVKLVDFGPDGIFGGGDDSEDELNFNPSTEPQFIPGQWVSLDIPLENFTDLQGRTNLAQMILSGADTIFLDNFYFHR